MKRLYIYSPYLWLAVGFIFLSSCSSHKELAHTTRKSSSVAEKASKEKALREKYAPLLGIPADDVTNYSLYSFIDEWYGTPYKWGGKTHDGVDCSDFVDILYNQVYNNPLTGNCSNLLEMCKTVKLEDLKEGDLIFFKINSSSVSHVGVYLTNNKFVHASVHSGVVISDLTTAYYKKYFYKAGRIKTLLTQNTSKG